MIGKSSPAGLWLSILGDGFLEAIDEHRDELMDSRLLGVAQGGVLTDLHDAHAAVPEKCPSSSAPWDRVRPSAWGEVNSRYISSAEHVDHG
jgi:hypothetical protein